jgi:tRNA dimethylallyltransferase
MNCLAPAVGTEFLAVGRVVKAGGKQIFTAGEYARRATGTLHEISARNHVPVVAGGTGFYLRALLDGLFPGPTRDDNLRARLVQRQTRRPGSLHRLLRRFDAGAAARIHANDVPKLIRALEVFELTGKPMSASIRRGDALEGYRTLKWASLGSDGALFAVGRALRVNVQRRPGG